MLSSLLIVDVNLSSLLIQIGIAMSACVSCKAGNKGQYVTIFIAKIEFFGQFLKRFYFQQHDTFMGPGDICIYIIIDLISMSCIFSLSWNCKKRKENSSLADFPMGKKFAERHP